MLKSRRGSTEGCWQQGCACQGCQVHLLALVVPEPGRRAVMDASCASTPGGSVRGFLLRCWAAREEGEGARGLDIETALGPLWALGSLWVKAVGLEQEPSSPPAQLCTSILPHSTPPTSPTPRTTAGIALWLPYFQLFAQKRAFPFPP